VIEWERKRNENSEERYKKNTNIFYKNINILEIYTKAEQITSK